MVLTNPFRFAIISVAGCEAEFAGIAQLVEQLICNQQVGGSSPSTSSKQYMGEFPSGQRGQTVNLLSVTSVVRIHLPPPKYLKHLLVFGIFYFSEVDSKGPSKKTCRWHVFRPVARAHAGESTFPHPTNEIIEKVN